MGIQAVSDLMTREVVKLEAKEMLGFADDVMGLARIRHMPVVDENGGVVGVVSQRDLFRGALARALGYGEIVQQRLYRMLRAGDVMTCDVVTVSPSTSIESAGKLMTSRKIGCLVVVDQGKLVGILTESDFVQLVVSTKGELNQGEQQ